MTPGSARSGPAPAAVHLDRLVAGGDALGRLADGRVVFVPGGLPGEDVLVRVVEDRRDFARAEIVRVAAPHESRVAPPCPLVAAGCGGCDWQHLAPAAQLAHKTQVVREALERTGRLQPTWLQPGGSVPSFGYRTTMRFAAGAPDQGGWCRPGLRRSRSNEVVAIGRCLVAHPLLDVLLDDVRLRDVDELTLRVSVAGGTATAWWTGGGDDRRGRRRRAPGGERRRGVVAGLPAHVETGEHAALVERVAGVDLRVSAAAFFQSGPSAAELLVATVAELAGDALAGATRVVDAYGGVGLFAATVAAAAPEVVLVESSPAACRDAAVNLRGRSASIVETAVEDWEPVAADVVVADPARQGLGRPGVAQVAATGARTVVLVSCDPVAGARDLAGLVAAGYRVTAARVLDLFPETHHVELVTRLDRAGARAGDRPL